MAVPQGRGVLPPFSSLARKWTLPMSLHCGGDPDVAPACVLTVLRLLPPPLRPLQHQVPIVDCIDDESVDGDVIDEDRDPILNRTRATRPRPRPQTADISVVRPGSVLPPLFPLLIYNCSLFPYRTAQSRRSGNALQAGAKKHARVHQAAVSGTTRVQSHAQRLSPSHPCPLSLTFWPMLSQGCRWRRPG